MFSEGGEVAEVVKDEDMVFDNMLLRKNANDYNQIHMNVFNIINKADIREF